jgi:hypothetical protein
MWFPQDDIVETRLRQALDTFPDANQRIVERPDGTSLMGNYIQIYDDGVAIQCLKYADGEPAGVLSMEGGAQVFVGEKRPGNGENFVDNAFFGFVSGNDVVSIGAGQNAAGLRYFLNRFFERAGVVADRNQFGLSRVANVNAVHKIHTSGGVAKLQMDLSLEEATNAYVEELAAAPRAGMIGKLGSVFGSLLDGGGASEELRRSRKGKMRVSVNVPNTDLLPAKNALNDAASTFLEDEEFDDYVLELRNGDTIKPGEMSVKKRVNFERYAQSVPHDAAFSEMRSFMQQLREDGQLDV